MGATGDVTVLARRTLIPRIVGDLAFTVVGIIFLGKGGRALLGL